MRRRANTRITAVFALLAAHCGNGDSKPDPVVTHDAAVVPAEVQLGYYYTTAYHAFGLGDDGGSRDNCPIFYGLQGGSWTMPAVRIRGMTSPGRFKASLITEAGEVLGEINQRQTFNTQTDGWAEIKRLPIPAHHAPPNDDAPIDDLFNQEATLSMSITDEEGHSASASADVVLIDQPILSAHGPLRGPVDAGGPKDAGNNDAGSDAN